MLYKAATNKEIINGTEYLIINLPNGSRSKKLFESIILNFHLFYKFSGGHKKNASIQNFKFFAWTYALNIKNYATQLINLDYNTTNLYYNFIIIIN